VKETNVKRGEKWWMTLDIATLKICADGGANRLFDHLPESERQRYGKWVRAV
jgi:thiamine pyrophosphokinase